MKLNQPVSKVTDKNDVVTVKALDGQEYKVCSIVISTGITSHYLPHKILIHFTLPFVLFRQNIWLWQWHLLCTSKLRSTHHYQLWEISLFREFQWVRASRITSFMTGHSGEKKVRYEQSNLSDSILGLFVTSFDARYCCSFLDCRIDKTREWMN